MGYDERHQSSSSGAIVAIVVAVLLVALLGVLAVAGAGYLLVGTTSSMQSQPATIDIRLVDDDEVIGEIQPSSVAAAPDPRLKFVLELDREGNTSLDGETIGLDDLRAELAKLKDETSNVFSVQVIADPECPIKHVIPVLDVCDEVSDIDVRIISSKGSDVRMMATGLSWGAIDDPTIVQLPVIPP